MDIYGEARALLIGALQIMDDLGEDAVAAHLSLALHLLDERRPAEGPRTH